MILTNCAACAAPLAHDAPRCVRCKTRYCDSTCQHDHWRRGHKQIYKKIHRGGNAEQYHAENKYKAAVAVAVEACAEDTKGQTCYICTEALHWKTKEGLVRMCACRGTAGFAHVSCLAEQAKILCAEAEENNLDGKVKYERFKRWHECSLCEQRYHGVVACTLGWACWKTYLGQSETDPAQQMSMNLLGNALFNAKHHEDASSVREAELATERRNGAREYHMLAIQGNLAGSYKMVGRLEDALPMQRDVYTGRVKLNGEEHDETLREANNYTTLLIELERFEEAKSLLRKTMPVARRVLGEDDIITLIMSSVYAEACYKDTSATAGDLRETVNMLEDTERIARRVLGGAHPTVVGIESALRDARAALGARENAAAGERIAKK